MKPERKPRKLCIVLAIAVLLLAGCTPKTPLPAPPSNDTIQPTADPLSIAAQHVTAGEYTAAVSLYRQALQAAPDDPRPALELARLYYTWKRPQSGLIALDEATRRNASTEETAPLRLALLALDGDWPRVTTEAEARLAAVPDDVTALEWLTRAQLQQYECAAAATTARHWYTVAPDNRDARIILGALEDDAVSLCEAEARFCTLPQVEGTVQLGSLLVHDGNWSLAACVLTRAVAANDASAEAHAWLGEALTRIGRPEEGRPHLVKAITLAPQSPLPWLLLGLHDLGQQRTDTAAQALQHARSLDPTNPLIYLSMAEVKAQSGDYDEVDAWIAAALNTAPKDADIAKAAARFYLERHLIQNEYPIRPIQSAIQIAPQDGEAYMLLGWYRLMTNDWNGARAALDEAIKLAPDLGQAHYLRGLALQATGDAEAARQAITRAADLGYWP
ncbi:MAG TPA: tetratricopeptide repeat protein [Anaerolineae bacterium]|nr:tetratricopeptide repeat protein [Anaerolineae bacterium]HQK12653.1 tetratricopeptide repeat protein [Anaerolineae bacterium]